MPLDRDADYVSYLYTCNRCRSCAVDPSPEMRPLCPAHEKHGYFAYSGGGKGYVAQGILEGKVKPSSEVTEVAMNCLLCGACATMCPPGFDTVSFIRDLRDHLVRRRLYLNDAHRELLERARQGKVWGDPARTDDLPVFDGTQEMLLFAGCRERARREILPPLRHILDAAGVTWGVLPDEPCCGAPLADLGDTRGFERMARKNLKTFNDAQASRILALCPHCASTLALDFLNVDDLAPEVVSVPRLLDELIGAGRLKLSAGRPVTVTFHDPCRLARFLEETEESRNVLGAMKGVKLVEMERSGRSTYCCGAGAWAASLVPDLSRHASRERIAEARGTGADLLVTACSYCTGMFKQGSWRKPAVQHITELVAQRVEKPPAKEAGRRKRSSRGGRAREK